MKLKLPRPALLAVVALLLWPLLLLAPCLFGSRTFLPYDLAQFPPASIGLTPEQLAEVRQGNNYDATELPIWVVPELQLAHQALAEGSLPEWNPYARSGTVLMAHGACGLLYPPNWLALMRERPEDALGWLCFVNFAIGALLCFGLLRELGCSSLAAAFGALCFCASGTAFANAPFYMRLSALMWLPGLLWSALRASRHQGAERLPALCAFAACLAMTWLSGFPPYSVACTLVAGGYVAWLGVAELRSSHFRQGKGYLMLMLAATATGFLLCAAHLLPAMRFFPETLRLPAASMQEVSRSTFDWYGFLGYLVPDLFGRPDLPPYDRSPLPLLLGLRTEWGGKPLLPNFNATEYAVFPGSIGVLMALLGVITGKGRGRWFALTALLVLWGMATFTVPFAWLFALPGLDAVTPLRFLAPASLMVAWLAAVGLDAVLQEGRRWLPMAAAVVLVFLALSALWGASAFGEPGVFDRWGLPERAAARYATVSDPGLVTADWVRNTYLRGPGNEPGRADYAELGRVQAKAALMNVVPWYFLLAACIGCLAVPWRERRWTTAASVAVVVLAALQLYFQPTPWVRGLSLVHPSTPTPVHEWLVQQKAQAREQGGFAVVRGARAAGLPTALPPGTLAPLGIRDLNVDCYFDRGTALALKTALGKDTAPKGYIEQSVPDARLTHPLLDLLGARYVLSNEALQNAGARVGPELRSHDGEREFFIYERPSPLPRAFVVPELRVVKDDVEAAAAVADPAFDPRAFAVVQAPGPEGNAPKVEAGAKDRTVRFVQDRPREVTLAVSAGPSGFLVLADAWLPGWTARLTGGEGTDLTIYRADSGLRAVRVPASACEVQFHYRTPGLRTGMWLSAFAAIALLAALIAGWLVGGDARQMPASGAGKAG